MATSLHVFLTEGRNESRFLREANAILSSGLADRVVLAGRAGERLAETEEVAPGVVVRRPALWTSPLPKSLPVQVVKALEWRARVIAIADQERSHAVVAHSLGALPVAAAIARRHRIPLVYDAHELETETDGLQGARQRFSRWVERRWIGACDLVVCVSDAIADWYASAYDIPRPLVVRNIPDTRWQGAERGTGDILRDRFGLGGDDILFICQGNLSPGRRIEQLLRVFAQSRRDRHVVFMGYGELEPQVREAAAAQPNIHFQPAVAPRDVLRHTASADVGLHSVENVCLSYHLSLPNKFFEYLHAGLPVIVPDWPEIGARVRAFDCGWVLQSEDDAAWLAAVNGVTRNEVENRKLAARRAAGFFRWEDEEARFVEAYAAVVAKSAASAG